MDLQAKIDELKLQDTPESNFQLGRLYATGPMCVRNYDEAVKYYKKAADAGLSEAQYHLGRMYTGEFGGKLNIQTALKYFNAAVDQNHGSACVELGDLFAKGKQVPKDQDKAEHLFNKAKPLLEMEMQKGNADAIAVLGYMYESGYGVPQDFAKAKELFEQAVALKNADAMGYLGMMYYQGQGVSQDFAKAKELLEQAVALGKASAIFRLGYMYKNGEGVPQNFAKAKEFFEQAMTFKESYSITMLGMMYLDDKGVLRDSAKAKELFEQAVALDNTDAMLILSNMYLKGQGVPQDFAKAKKLLEQAVALGNTSAMTILGNLYVDGQGVTQDFAKAKELYEQAVALGHAGAMSQLGNLYQYGQGVPQDFVKAKELFEQAVALGDDAAMTRLGFLYQNGQGVLRNLTKTKELYEQAVALDNDEAMVKLGLLYQKGRSVPQDFVKAKELFEQAMALGNDAAMANLGLLYQKGQGVPQDFAKAKALFEQALALDNTNDLILSILGIMYLKGQGIPQDFAKAKDLFEQSVALDNTDAMIILGNMYLKGQGVPQDFVKAKELFEQAVNLGIPQAMTQLGELYLAGKGVTQDFAKAKELFEQAMALRDADAITNIGSLYHTGQGVSQDFAKARKLFEQAVALGNVAAMFFLSFMCRHGKGGPKDYAKARELHAKIYASGDKLYILKLDNVYRSGQGVPSTYVELIERLQAADTTTDLVVKRKLFQDTVQYLNAPVDDVDLLAKPKLHGFPIFTAAVGFHSFMHGKYDDAFNRLSSSDYQAAPEIHFALGVMYDQSLGTKPDQSKAQSHLTIAAESNYAEAMHYLAFKACLVHDSAAAFAWFKQAANSKDPLGLCEMGIAHWCGIRVAPDYRQVQSNFKKAVRQSYKTTKQSDMALAEFLLVQFALNEYADAGQGDNCLAAGRVSKALMELASGTNFSAPSYLDSIATNRLDSLTMEAWLAYVQLLDSQRSTPLSLTSASALSELKQKCEHELSQSKLNKQTHDLDVSEAPHISPASAVFHAPDINQSNPVTPEEWIAYAQNLEKQSTLPLSHNNASGLIKLKHKAADTAKSEQAEPMQLKPADYEHCSCLVDYLLGQLYLNQDSALQVGVDMLTQLAASTSLPSQAAYLQAAAAFKLGLHYEALAGQSGQNAEDNSSLEQALTYFKQAATAASSLSSFDFRSLYRLKALLKLCKYYSDDNFSTVTPESLPFYQQAAAEGLVVVGLPLGNWYQSHGETAQAVEAYDLAAQAGNAQAQLLLGKIYHSEPNFLNQAKAQELFESALALGQTEAALPLADILEQGQDSGTNNDSTLERVFELYFQAAQTGDAEAQFRTGQCYINGHGTEASAQKALSWLEKAATQQHPQALFTLAQMYELGQDVPLNQAKAHDQYQQAASLGSEDAANVLAKQQLLSGGQGNTQELLQQLKNSGDQATVLNFYLKQLSKLTACDAATANSEQKAEVERALLGLKELADDGLLDAQIAVAQFYESEYVVGAAGDSGESVDAQAEAQIYHSMAAEQGYIPSFVALADYAWHNNDYAGALEWYTKLIEAAKKAVNKLPQGYVAQAPASTATASPDTGFKVRVFTSDDLHAALAQANFALGRCYEKGLGVETDCKKAADWYSKASELGQAEARLALALLYLNGGQGFKADERQAITLLSKLAKRKVAAGQYELGKAYLAGQGVKADPKQAFAMIKAAAEQKHPAAMALLSELYAKGTGTAANPKHAQSWLYKAKAAGWKA